MWELRNKEHENRIAERQMRIKEFNEFERRVPKLSVREQMQLRSKLRKEKVIKIIDKYKDQVKIQEIDKELLNHQARKKHNKDNHKNELDLKKHVKPK
mmetsp:Transcript_41799/g.48277  ORF Transcript_41799/g.48277 Transcript_41799/m.48277 type:complete len:98 (+) Transcript_41799:277-570(+)